MEEDTQHYSQNGFIVFLIVAFFAVFFGIGFLLPESSESVCTRLALNISGLQYEKSTIENRKLYGGEQPAPLRAQHIENELELLNRDFGVHCEKYKKYFNPEAYATTTTTETIPLNPQEDILNSFFEDYQEQDLWEVYNSEQRNKEFGCVDLAINNLTLLAARGQAELRLIEALYEPEAMEESEEIDAELRRVQEAYDANCSES